MAFIFVIAGWRWNWTLGCVGASHFSQNQMQFEMYHHFHDNEQFQEVAEMTQWRVNISNPIELQPKFKLSMLEKKKNSLEICGGIAWWNQ